MALLWLAASFIPGSVLAQENPLQRVESLSAQGQVEEARGLLMVWWEHRAPRASRTELQRGIWLRGKLTVDPALAELDFRRLVVEYPGGDYSDDALFRLALLAAHRGDPASASRHLSSLVRDYPTSPLKAQAQAWLARPELTVARGTGEPPTREPSRRYRTRGDPTRTDMVSAPLSVQVGAFQDPARARTLARGLEALGYSPRLARVPGSDLLRVRLGRFFHREGADALAKELRERGFECTLSSDAHLETPVG